LLFNPLHFCDGIYLLFLETVFMDLSTSGPPHKEAIAVPSLNALLRATPRKTLTAAVFIALIAVSLSQVARPSVDDQSLRKYVGTYAWGPDHFVYVQMWSEFTGKNDLVAFDESGDVRTLFPAEDGRFVTGPGAAVPDQVESQVDFNRDASGRILSLSWRNGNSVARTADRIENEKREDVSFSNSGVHLAGTLICPMSSGRHPAIVLVPASGAEDREYLLPFAHFLVRHGMAVLGYDKRGVGGSTGDWRTESFDDLASDARAAIEFLKTRRDIDASQIGMLGWSQAGWVMPLAVAKEKDTAFVISISGAGVSPAETTLDEARGELKAAGRRPEVIEQITELMKLKYDFARTGQGWNEYTAARDKLVAKFGNAPDGFPSSPDDPYWKSIRALYFYDPAPSLRELRVPVLALFGELDDNIVAEKNQKAWDSALRTGGNRDYTLRTLPGTDHMMLEAKVGNNAEMPTLQRFSPSYFATVQNWLANRIRGFHPSK
jgi:pimeloyl-ACP methyl ester carboxylesterase